MSETWYVVPAAFALRNAGDKPRQGAGDDRSDVPSTWILPEAWRKAADPRPGVTQNGSEPRTPLAKRPND